MKGEKAKASAIRVICSGRFLRVLLPSLPADWMVPIWSQPSCCARPRLGMYGECGPPFGVDSGLCAIPAPLVCTRGGGVPTATRARWHRHGCDATPSAVIHFGGLFAGPMARPGHRAPPTCARQRAHEVCGLALRPQEAADLGMRMQGTAGEMTAGVATVGRGRLPSPPLPLPSLSVDPERGGAWML